MSVSSERNGVMPSTEVKQLGLSLFSLVNAPLSQRSRLSPAAYHSILLYCGVRPDLSGWRRFLTVLLTLLGLLSIVAGVVFFLAWNWAVMSKFVKFALAELLIVALAVVVWRRWYDAVARAALLALGLSFGALFALYGQIYQTGADSWELFRAWALVLFPLALLGRQNGLWFCTWFIANLAFQLYYFSRALLSFDDISPLDLPWISHVTLYSYVAVQAGCLLLREAFAAYVVKKNPHSWLSSRWFSRVMAAYLLLTITPPVVDAVFSHANSFTTTMAMLWGGTLLAGYGYYRYRLTDLCMLMLGVASVMVVGCALIAQLFSHTLSNFDLGGLFMMGLMMALWLAAGGAILLNLRRKLYSSRVVEIAPDATSNLLSQLHQRQMLNDEQVAEVENMDHADQLPWYLHAALAVGGWVAAMIILLLLGLLIYAVGLLDNLNGITLVVPSLIIAALAACLLRAEGIGTQHIGFAWAIAATYGLAFGVYLLIDPDVSRHFFLGWLSFLPVLAIMALAMPNRLFRFMAVTAFIFILIFSLGYAVSLLLPPRLTIGVMALLVGCILALWFWVIARQDRPQTATIRELTVALFYGIPAGLMLLCLADVDSSLMGNWLWNFSATGYLAQVLSIGLALGLVASGLLQVLAFRSPNTLIYLPAAILYGVIAFFAPGIGFGLVLVLMARYQGSKALLAVSGCFLALYLVYWYAFLGITLLQKSLLLGVSGIVLLGLAYAAKKWLPAQKEVADAN